MYKLIFNRDYDVSGYKLAMSILNNGTSREETFNSYFTVPEFTSNASLQDKTNYIKRLYKYILKREATAADISSWSTKIKAYNNSGTGDYTWYQAYEAFVATTEYQTNVCHNSYYTYGSKLKENTPTLDDLFNGNARLQTMNEGQTVNLKFKNNNQIFDQKIALLYDKASGKHFAYTRGYDATTDKFNLYLFETTDGLNFEEIGPIFEKPSNVSLYDAQIAVDYSVCPAQYIMTLECDGSLCTSTSSTPFKAETWTYPIEVIKAGKNNNRYYSASTGVTLIDGTKKYISWTEIDDGRTNFMGNNNVLNPDDGDESANTKGIEVNSFKQDLGLGSNYSTIFLPAEKNVKCTSGWDCNNKDAQDWKKEGSFYYLMYNGANYYRCFRPNPSDGTNAWALSIARSTEPLANYTTFLPQEQRINAVRNDLCGISYPIINNFGGELFMYYAYYLNDANRTAVIKRSKLVANCKSGNNYCPPGCNNSNDSDCSTACVPSCTDKQCGNNGCGGSCGTCPTGQTCYNGSTCAVPTCTPNCTGKSCGDSDGCSGKCVVQSCGTGKTCNASGMCESTPTPTYKIEDIDKSGTVDLNDYTFLLIDYKAYKTSKTLNSRSDFNNDSKVDLNDYTMFLIAYRKDHPLK